MQKCKYVRVELPCHENLAKWKNRPARTKRYFLEDQSFCFKNEKEYKFKTENL